jgi:hypothetical protein
MGQDLSLQDDGAGCSSYFLGECSGGSSSKGMYT